jgi:hypothetical protein
MFAIAKTNNNTPNKAPVDPQSTFVLTDGWYVFLAVVLGILTANTRVGPITAGILTIGLIYQSTLLLEGK